MSVASASATRMGSFQNDYPFVLVGCMVTAALAHVYGGRIVGKRNVYLLCYCSLNPCA